MSLRTRLALAFFFLAVVPLAAVTLHSYHASEQAFREAAQQEGANRAEDMRKRLDAATNDLQRRLAYLGRVPAPRPAHPLPAEGDAETTRFLREVERAMGEDTTLLRSLEFVPRRSDRVAVVPPPAPLDAPSPPPGPLVPILMLLDAAGASEAEGGSPRWVLKTMESVAEQAAAVLEEEVQAQKGEEYARQAAEFLRDMSRRITREAADVAREAAEHERASKEQQRTGKTLRELGLHLAREFGVELHRDGAAVGMLRAQVHSRRLLSRVFEQARRHPDEIPFALDADGHLHCPPGTNASLEALNLTEVSDGTREVGGTRDWVVVTRRDPGTGLTLGVARPVGRPLRKMRQAALANLALGFGIVLLAGAAVLPLSRRMTRDLDTLSEGAERLASGDLEARVPVRSRDEFGRLAATFNRMAGDLRSHQEQLLDRARLKKEIELCRRIQEEMLPHHPLRAPFAEVRGVSIPAREVGGDFFNYFLLPSGEAALLVGDVSGKGVPAALMMANLQATLRARLPVDGLVSLAQHLDEEIDANTPKTVYLTCFIGVLDGARHRMRYINAGHNPPLLLRADGAVQPLQATGRPLGLLPGGGYTEEAVDLGDGDCLFLYTDGVVESEDARGEPFGLERLERLLVRERTAGPEGLLALVEQELRAHRGSGELDDDATLLVLRFGAAAPGGA